MAIDLNLPTHAVHRESDHTLLVYNLDFDPLPLMDGILSEGSPVWARVAQEYRSRPLLQPAGVQYVSYSREEGHQLQLYIFNLYTCPEPIRRIRATR